MRLRPITFRLGASAAAVLGIALQAASAQPGRAATNLSGYWELQFDSRNVPPAPLRPEVAAEDREAQYKREMAEIRWCHFFGLPYSMEVSPIDILQNVNGKEVVITSPLRTPSRHIYTDGRGHVSADIFDPVSNGHSIGHWEGDTLIVDTT